MFTSHQHHQHGQHGQGHGHGHGQGHGHHESHRNTRLLHHDNSHQHVMTEIIERIDEVIELVDCGGRDLGFCDMDSKYPG